MEIFKTWEEAGIDLKGKVKGEVKCLCPKCSEDRRNSKDLCLSVNIDKEVWNCHHCQWKGSLSKRGGEPEKVYKKPDFTPESPTEKMAAWFKKYRGIERETLEKFMISPIKKYIGLAQAEVNCIAFPYIKGTEIVNVKSRYDYQQDGKSKKTFAMEKDAELTFFNINSIEGTEHCVIVEGEIDCMAVWQATQYPCVSVPNGASKGDQKLEYLNNAARWLQNKKAIVLATDGDDAGIALRDELARRLGKDRCYYIKYPDGCKDMNEVLMQYGPDKVADVLEDVYSFPIDGVVTVESVSEQIDHYYEHGYPVGDKIGYPEFDELLSFRGGEVTTITGIPGHGKSEWLDQILQRLTQRYRWPHGIFAAENGTAALHYTRIAHRLVGKPFSGQNRMTREELEGVKLFMNDYFFFINRKEVRPTIENLLEKGKEMVLRRGIRSFVIDPYNCLESSRPAHVTETEYVSQIYDRIVDFAELYNVHVFLVAHPTKLKKVESTGNFEVPTMYSISGSANFYNKTYNGMSVYRDFHAKTTRIYVQKVKFDFIGKVGYADFDFDITARAYKELSIHPNI